MGYTYKNKKYVSRDKELLKKIKIMLKFIDMPMELMS